MQKASSFAAGLTVYKLIIDIIVSLIFVYFLVGMLKPVLTSIKNSPVQNGIYGLAFLILVPILSIFLLFLLFLGIVSFLFYALILVLSIYISKIFLGWVTLRWWYRRDKTEYALDWKAAVVGPIALFIIALIPILGWLFLAILYLITIGAVIRKLAMVTKSQRVTSKSRS